MPGALERLEHAAGAWKAELRGAFPRWLILSRFGVEFLDRLAPRGRELDVVTLGGERMRGRRLHVGGVEALAVEHESGARLEPFDEALPIFLAGRLGAHGVLVLLAAGALAGFERAPAITAIRDWIRIGDGDPLRGIDPVRLGARFPELRGLARADELAITAGLLAEHGEPRPAIAIARRGPSGATDAELRAWRSLGGELVVEGCGAEVVAARQQGLASVALALVLDRADAVPPADPGTLAESAGLLLPRLAALLPELLRRLDESAGERQEQAS